MEIDIKETVLYLVKHKPSGSQIQVKCALDKKQNPKLLSVDLLSGKIIPLQGVKTALQKLKKDHSNTPPDQIA